MPQSNNSNESGTYSYTVQSGPQEGEVYGGSFATAEGAESSGYTDYEGENVIVTGGGGGTPVFRGTREQYQRQRTEQRLEKEGIQLEGDLMRHEAKYYKYIKDGKFEVTDRWGRPSKHLTKQKWIEYREDLISLEKDIADYKLDWGGYASKYDIKSWDTKVKATYESRKQAGEDLLKGTYAQTRGWVGRKHDTFKAKVQSQEYGSLYQKYQRQGLKEEGRYGALALQYGRGISGSVGSGLGNVALGGADLVWSGVKAIPRTTRFIISKPKESMAIATLGIKYGAKLAFDPKYAGLRRAYAKQVLKTAKRDPFKFGAEFYFSGGMYKGARVGARALKGKYNKRFYTELRYEFKADPYSKVRGTGKKASSTFNQRLIQKEVKVRDWRTKFGGKKTEKVLDTKTVEAKTTGRSITGKDGTVINVKTEFTKKDFGGRAFRESKYQVRLDKSGKGEIRKKYVDESFRVDPYQVRGRKEIKTSAKEIGDFSEIVIPYSPLVETGLKLNKISKAIQKSAPIYKGKMYKVETTITPSVAKGQGLYKLGKPKTTTSQALVDKKYIRSSQRQKDLVDETPKVSRATTQVIQRGRQAQIGQLTQDLAPKIKTPKPKKISKQFKVKPIKSQPIGRATTYQEYGVLGEGGLAPQTTGTGLTPITGLSMKNLTKAGTIQRSRFKIAGGVASRTGIGQDIGQALKTKTTTKSKTKPRTTGRLATIGIFKPATIYTPRPPTLKYKKFTTGKPPKIRQKRLPNADFNIKIPKIPAWGRKRKSTQDEKLGKRKTKRRARYAPSLTGVALRIKQTGTKRGQFTGLEVRGI